MTFDAVDLAIMVPKLTDVYFKIEDLKESLELSLNSLTGTIETQRKMRGFPWLAS